MKLTDADKKNALLIVSPLSNLPSLSRLLPYEGALYLAGKRAGREDMRERAAKACMEFLHDPWCCAGSCAEAIRALGVDDE